MPRIEIRGVVVPDDDLFAYQWFGMDACSPKLVKRALADAKGSNVEVLLNSGGGDVNAGAEIYTMLREYSGKVLIKIQSFAASAAAVISQAGESEISPVAQLMIHNVSSYAAGDNRDMAHMAQVLKNANKALASAFVAKTGKSEAEVLELMAKETWFTAEQAVKEGFVDRVMFAEGSAAVQPVKLAASHSGLLPANVIEYARRHINSAGARAQAEYQYMIMEGKVK